MFGLATFVDVSCTEFSDFRDVVWCGEQGVRQKIKFFRKIFFSGEFFLFFYFLPPPFLSPLVAENLGVRRWRQSETVHSLAMAEGTSRMVCGFCSVWILGFNLMMFIKSSNWLIFVQWGWP